MMQGLKKFGTGTGERYRYPGARVTASAVWRLCIFLVRGVLGIGAHHIARDPVMGIIIPMKPAIEGARSGR
jgi:hypothetical protein